MFVTSLSPARYAFFPKLFEPNPSLTNYYEGLFGYFGGYLGKGAFIDYFRNSLIVALGATAVSLIVSITSGYALARFKFRGNKFLSNTVLASYIIPSTFLVVPLYILLQKYRMIDTYYGVILAETAFIIPYCIWIFREHFKAIPVEVMESAQLDGASPLKVITSIAIPLSIGTIVALATYAFVQSWNEFLLVLVLTSTKSTVPIGLFFLLGGDQVPWGSLMAMSLLFSIPPVLFYHLFQQYMTRGIMAGAVKA
jgi:multiple sugar transport system permease protein/raffinose/stachyose/melibiose transport system permease protein